MFRVVQYFLNHQASYVSALVSGRVAWMFSSQDYKPVVIRVSFSARHRIHPCARPHLSGISQRPCWFAKIRLFFILLSFYDFSIPRYETVTYGKHSIRYLGPRLWTKLPKNIRDVTTLMSFKGKISQLNISELLDDGCAGCSLCSSCLLYIFYYKSRN